MASSTKYQPAPQRDSFEEGNYTEAPPSYQAESSSNNHPAPGAPRQEDDNIPDDFKVRIPKHARISTDIHHIVWRLGCGSHITDSHAVYSEGLRYPVSFTRRLGHHQLTDFKRTVQLLATTVLSSISFASDSYKEFLHQNVWLVFVSLIGSIGFMLLTYWKRKSYPTNLLFLGGFTAFEAYAISVVVSFYQSSIVLEALVLTLGIFVALSLFACQTKYDFTSWIPYLFGGLWTLILFGFVLMFFKNNSTTELIYGLLGALLFCGYILVDTQLVIRHYHVEEEIAAAISLYLDIINLFLMILRILNSQQNN